jgi:hyperosmotically inducible protein
MSDKQLRQDILDEFEFDPSFNAAHIGVAVDKNVVSLTGHVESYAEKLAVLGAARRVKGVQAIADEVEVRFPNQSKTADDQIAQRATDILKWNSVVSSLPIDVVVRNGWITLSGRVNWYFEKRAAENCVRKLSGVRGITNSIIVKPQVDAANIKEKIEAALKRHAEVEANGIRISVKGGDHVVLEGRVGNWDERRAVETAAWSAPGVAAVEDRLSIG